MRRTTGLALSVTVLLATGGCYALTRLYHRSVRPDETVVVLANSRADAGRLLHGCGAKRATLDVRTGSLILLPDEPPSARQCVADRASRTALLDLPVVIYTALTSNGW